MQVLSYIVYKLFPSVLMKRSSQKLLSVDQVPFLLRALYNPPDTALYSPLKSQMLLTGGACLGHVSTDIVGTCLKHG